MNTRASSTSLLTLGLFVLLAFCAAAGGALFPPGAEFAALTRPSFAPPNWLFGPVWTILYLLMALAAWLVWRRGGGLWSAPLRAWYLQLALNAVWTPLFFGLTWRGVALIEMALLWIMIVVTVRRFAAESRSAAWLLAPYLAWVSFAFVLNAAYWWLNR